SSFFFGGVRMRLLLVCTTCCLAVLVLGWVLDPWAVFAIIAKIERVNTPMSVEVVSAYPKATAFLVCWYGIGGALASVPVYRFTLARPRQQRPSSEKGETIWLASGVIWLVQLTVNLLARFGLGIPEFTATVGVLWILGQCF